MKKYQIREKLIISFTAIFAIFSIIVFLNTTLKYNGNNPELKTSLFKNGDEYFIRSGTLNISSQANNILDAYINIEGREKNATEYHFYRTDKSFNFNELLKPEENNPIPVHIINLQNQLSHN